MNLVQLEETLSKKIKQIATLDDPAHDIDHFFAKLFKTAETLKTESAREEGFKRAEFMRTYLNQLKGELTY